jgi:hypothetical protein
MISPDAIYAAALQLYQVKFMTDELEPTPGWRNGGRMKAWEECVAVALDFANAIPNNIYSDPGPLETAYLRFQNGLKP